MTSADVETWLTGLNEQSVKMSPDIFEKWKREIAERYSEEWRHYHTLQHLSDMMSHLDRWRSKITDFSAVALAILFHDIVYDPKSSTNEEDSVNLFKEFASDACLDEKLLKRVEGLIRATIEHLPDDPTKADSDLAFFLDFDMAILGQSEQEYDKYASNIQREYCHMQREAFQRGRANVLQTFLKWEKIYATTEFWTEYEAVARSNIQREIDRLTL